MLYKPKFICTSKNHRERASGPSQECGRMQKWEGLRLEDVRSWKLSLFDVSKESCFLSLKRHETQDVLGKMPPLNHRHSLRMLEITAWLECLQKQLTVGSWRQVVLLQFSYFPTWFPTYADATHSTEGNWQCRSMIRLYTPSAFPKEIGQSNTLRIQTYLHTFIPFHGTILIPFHLSLFELPVAISSLLIPLLASHSVQDLSYISILPPVPRRLEQLQTLKRAKPGAIGCSWESPR